MDTIDQIYGQFKERGSQFDSLTGFLTCSK